MIYITRICIFIWCFVVIYLNLHKTYDGNDENHENKKYLDYYIVCLLSRNRYRVAAQNELEQTYKHVEMS